MADILEKLCRKFSSKLVEAYELLRENGVVPQLAQRQNSILIFFALESCRDICGELAGVPRDQTWCRFTLGKIDDENKQTLRTILSPLRGVNPTLLEIPERLSEFAFDFSISSMSIDEGYSASEPSSTGSFQFLLIAESELEPSEDEVMKDLLRLVGAAAPLKVMVFNHWGRDLRSRLTQVLERCTPNGDYQKAPWRADWLFLGVPTYTDWCSAGGDKEKLRQQIYCLPSGSKTIDLKDGNAWWAL